MSMLKPEFVDSLASLGPVADGLADALTSTIPSVSVRINQAKCKGEMPMIAVDGERVEWASSGMYLSERPRFTFDPALHQGLYYVQDASSMFVGHALKSFLGDDTGPLTVLDACAAPGGKTTAVIDALPAGSVIVANEIVPKRAAVLKENIIKWGCPAVIVTRADTADIARARVGFDVIVADVPCSGEGMMRKDAEAASQWSRGLVADCAALQRQIVSNLWQTLRPGGLMLYSTCTFNTAENEENVHWAMETLGAENPAIPTQPSWGVAPSVVEGINACRFMQHRLRGEGLFMAALRKPLDAPASSQGKAKNKAKSKTNRANADLAKAAKECARWLTDSGAFDIIVEGDRVSALPHRATSVYEALRTVVDVIHQGVPLATLKGRDLVPAQALAMSTALRPEAFATVEVDRDTALAYLRREALTLPGDTPKGIVLLTYGNHPLGWAKNLCNRANNLYPNEWRIMSSGE